VPLAQGVPVDEEETTEEPATISVVAVLDSPQGIALTGKSVSRSSSSDNRTATVRKHLIWAVALVVIVAVVATVVVVVTSTGDSGNGGNDVNTTATPSSTEPPFTLDPQQPSGPIEIKITASDGAASDRFGNNLAIDGNILAVGAVFDDENGEDSGSVYVFRRDTDGSWTEQAKITPSDGASADNWFGRGLALDGDTLVVGANEGLADSFGSVYVYVLSDGDTWTEQAKLTAIGGKMGDGYGSDLAISADTLIVGANLDPDIGGSVYVYKRSGTEWVEQDKLIASDSIGSDEFGLGLATNGNVVVVGSYKNLNDGVATGSVYIYSLLNGAWTEQASKLLASDGEDGDEFGQQ